MTFSSTVEVRHDHSNCSDQRNVPIHVAAFKASILLAVSLSPAKLAEEAYMEMHPWLSHIPEQSPLRVIWPYCQPEIQVC